MLPYIIAAVIIVTLITLYILSFGIYIVRQAEVILIERLGKFRRELRPGLNFVIPVIDRPRTIYWTYLQDTGKGTFYRSQPVTYRIDLREAVYDFPKQNVITRDNVTMQINALLYYKIFDPKAAVYEVEDLPEAIEKLTQTTLRNVIGAMDLDETLVSRDQINEKLRIFLDEATDKWGVKVDRVELQEVKPSEDIRQTMERQMRAERDRRAVILEAEGKKRAAILEAEGQQESQLLKAKGEAAARVEIAEAEAKSIDLIKKAFPEQNPLQYLVATQYIKTLPELMKGKEGKFVVVPYEISGIMGSISVIKEMMSK